MKKEIENEREWQRIGETKSSREIHSEKDTVRERVGYRDRNNEREGEGER